MWYDGCAGENDLFRMIASCKRLYKMTEGADMLKRLIRITNDLKLKHKLLISYVLVVMIPVLIIGLAVTSYFRQQALDNAIGQTIINVDKIKVRRQRCCVCLRTYPICLCLTRISKRS